MEFFHSTVTYVGRYFVLLLLVKEAIVTVTLHKNNSAKTRRKLLFCVEKEMSIFPKYGTNICLLYCVYFAT